MVDEQMLGNKDEEDLLNNNFFSGGNLMTQGNTPGNSLGLKFAKPKN